MLDRPDGLREERQRAGACRLVEGVSSTDHRRDALNGKSGIDKKAGCGATAPIGLVA